MSVEILLGGIACISFVFSLLAIWLYIRAIQESAKDKKVIIQDQINTFVDFLRTQETIEQKLKDLKDDFEISRRDNRADFEDVRDRLRRNKPP